MKTKSALKGKVSFTATGKLKVARGNKNHFKEFQNIFSNADMGTNEIRMFCSLDSAGTELLKMAMTKLGLSARAYDRILKVSRTIADIEGSEKIEANHISEAIQYRSLDRELWMH